MPKNFKRKIENFVCDKCGTKVKGNGYTNHCPNCLWSKHVDIIPGDRAAQCHGMMEPIILDTEGGEYNIVHYCAKCGHQKRNKVSKDDNFEEILKINLNHNV